MVCIKGRHIDAHTFLGAPETAKGGNFEDDRSVLGVDERVDHVSTGGGASLELIEQGDLPGLAALRS